MDAKRIDELEAERDAALQMLAATKTAAISWREDVEILRRANKHAIDERNRIAGEYGDYQKALAARDNATLAVMRLTAERDSLASDLATARREVERMREGERRCYVCEAMTTTLDVCNGCFDKPADKLDALTAERDAAVAKRDEDAEVCGGHILTLNAIRIALREAGISIAGQSLGDYTGIVKAVRDALSQLAAATARAEDARTVCEWAASAWGTDNVHESPGVVDAAKRYLELNKQNHGAARTGAAGPGPDGTGKAGTG